MVGAAVRVRTLEVVVPDRKVVEDVELEVASELMVVESGRICDEGGLC